MKNDVYFFSISNEGECQVFTDSELTKKIIETAALLNKSTGIWNP